LLQIQANIRLRPVRFAFVVKPTDRRRLLDVFRVNTCLWGGVFNPIVPKIQRIPAWWSRDRFSFYSAKQIVDGYLDFFEPDYLIESEPGLGDGLGFAKDRIIQMGDVLSSEGQRHPSGVGQDVFALYRSLYKTEFQFARRDQHNIVDAKPERGPG
jgi:hypothetical protein